MWFPRETAQRDTVLAHGLTFDASGQVCSQREQCEQMVNLISGLKKEARTPKLPFWAMILSNEVLHTTQCGQGFRGGQDMLYWLTL